MLAGDTFIQQLSTALSQDSAMPHPIPSVLEYVHAPTITPLRDYSSLPDSFITADTKIKLGTGKHKFKIQFTYM